MDLLLGTVLEYPVNVCLERIFQLYLVTEATLYLHGRGDVEHLVLRYPVVYYDYRKPVIGEVGKFYGYLVVVNQGSMDEVFSFASGLAGWNPRASLVVWYNGNVTKLLEVLARHRLYSVAIVDDHGNIVGYAPFSEEDFNVVDLTVVPMGTCSGDLTWLFGSWGRLYWSNSTAVVSYMPLRPYVLSAEAGDGIEIEIAQMLSKKLGFKIRYDATVYDNWGYRENGTYNGVFAALESKTADFVLGHFHLRHEHIDDFDYTFSYMEDDLAWGVPSAAVMSHWANLVHIFSAKSWTCILLTLLCSSASWWYFGRHLGGYHGSLYVLEVPFLTLLQLAPPIPAPTPATKLLYVTTWMCCFVTMSVWCSYLTYALTHESFEAQITNTEELILSDLHLGLHPELARMYASSGGHVGDYIGEHFTECDASYACMDRVAHQRDMASITTIRIFKYSLPERYQTKEGKNIAELIDETVIKDFTVMYFQKGHPLFDRVNEMLYRLRGGGFVKHLDDICDFNNELQYGNPLFAKKLFETKVLAMNEMKGPFYLLGVLLSISTCIFAAEVWYFRIRSRRKRIDFINKDYDK